MADSVTAERRPDRTRGPRHDEFWAFCDQGELRVQSCAACGRLSWPVVDECEHCGSPELSWAAMSGRGKVAAWCTFEYDYYKGTLPIPYDTILVELDEGPMFVSNPKGFGFRDIEIGMPVKLAFFACEDAGGPFQLPVFERA
jgi:uncharacterized OB-fold protein